MSHEDYGFAPGLTNFQTLFARRGSNTVVIKKKAIGTLQSFFAYLNSSKVPHPIGNMLIGTHGNAEGHLSIPIFRGQSRKLHTYELLEQTLADPSHSIKIANETIAVDPNGTSDKIVHIKGCNIGKSRPFLVKFKQAVGNKVTVTAPKHFYWIQNIPEPKGSVEALRYEFVIANDTALDLADLVSRLSVQGFTDIDGNQIDSSSWDKWTAWLPKKGALNSRSKPTNFPLGETIGNSTAKTTTTCEVPYGLRVVQEVVGPWTVDCVGYDPRQSTNASRAAADLKRVMLLESNFAATHPFPVFKRRGFASINAFISGFTWTWTKVNSDPNDYNATGKRIEHTLIVPITNPSNGNLIFNFYPALNTTPDKVIHLVESDTRFFETVLHNQTA